MIEKRVFRRFLRLARLISCCRQGSGVTHVCSCISLCVIRLFHLATTLAGSETSIIFLRVVIEDIRSLMIEARLILAGLQLKKIERTIASGSRLCKVEALELKVTEQQLTMKSVVFRLARFMFIEVLTSRI